jgi:WhiB family transcriptional regulator, redox-sensing transcriptional regulator
VTPKQWVMIVEAFWREGGLCADYPTEVFFPTSASGVSRAKAVCQGCPHEIRCRDYAIAIGARGVWGGTSHQERKRLVRNRRKNLT